MSLSLALYQPDIANNTGTLLRLGACMGVSVHIVHPTGFPFSRAALKRAGMDYLDHVEMIEHTSFSAFARWRTENARRLVLLTTKSDRSVYDIAFTPDDILLLGRESAGVPQSVVDAADVSLRIPMRQRVRSLNIAIAGAIVLGEAMRQTNHLASLT